MDLGRRFRAAARRPRARRRNRRPCGGARTALRLRRLRRGCDRGRAEPRTRSRPRAGADPCERRARRPPDVHGDARAAAHRRRPGPCEEVLGANRVTTIRVGHLYPDYLNIYADRGNIAVLTRRAAWRGHELMVEAVGMGDSLRPGAHDLLYVGGGQDREQMLVARDLAAKAEDMLAAHAA